MVGISYSDQQLDAVTMVLNAPPGSVVGVTGEAGTGKTTTLRLLLDKLRDTEIDFALAAPTGKAAKRISEATEHYATTIHKLLGYGHPKDLNENTGEYRDSTLPKYDSQTPLPHDLIIIDEASMVAHQQRIHLTEALKAGAKIALFGDIQQLPPVETEYELKNQPSWFQTVLGSNQSVTLKQVYRQAEQSVILQNARSLLRGGDLIESEDFTIIRSDHPHGELLNFVNDHPEFMQPHSQIVLPRQTGPLGARAASSYIQSQMRGERIVREDGLKLLRHKWDADEPIQVLEGDKIIFTKNYYAGGGSEFEVFNGETGVIVKIFNDRENRFSVDLGDRIVVVPNMIEVTINKRKMILYPERDVHLAYALTTHKTQGSEYKSIAYVMCSETQFVQSRSNKYTAVTRAREKVYLLSDTESLGETSACSIF